MNGMFEVRMLLAMGAIVFSVGAAHSQECPVIAVSQSPEKFYQGQPAVFTATIDGTSARVHRVNWLVSAGTIVSGQGTRSITVDTNGVVNSIMAKVTFTVRAPGRCNLSAEAYAMPIPPARKLDEYRSMSSAAEAKRLRLFVDALNNDPWATAYVISYGGRTSDESTARKGSERVKEALIKQGIREPMIATIDGGYKEMPTIELWIVPTGALLPQPSPTVDANEVRPAKSAVRKTTTKKKA